jgi:hypothetical protein
MPRQARLDAPGTLHHVMVRGIEGCPIFLNDQGRYSGPETFRTVVSIALRGGEGFVAQ